MADSEFERALEYSNAAMGFLSKGRVPPYPQFYELFYTYATGVNPALNERLNEILADKSGAIASDVESLYDEFLRSKAVDERINAVSEKISANIKSVHVAISTASNSAEHYSGSLTEAEVLFEKISNPEQLKTLAHQLLEETRNMQQVNRSLEKQLEVSSADIDMLKKDLEEVQRESMTDALTKISNRKCFDRAMEKELTIARERNEPMCLAIIDIDHFKKFNDTYGHQTGDQVLRLVAMTMRAHTKGRDLAARYGGEEFGLILPTTKIKDASKLAEKIRVAIQGKELLRRSTNEKLGRVTASFGIAQYREGDTAISLIERADNAMYAAKANGRNRVVTEFDKVAQIYAATQSAA